MLGDLRYALRGLLRSPGLTAAVLLSLGVGIGANVAVFTVLDRVLFQAPPGVRDPQTVRRVYMRERTNSESYRTEFSYPAFEDIARAASGKARVEAYTRRSERDLNEGAARVSVAYVTSGYFDMLGVRPTAGRVFSADEHRFGDPHPVALISSRAWRSLFGSERSAIGRTIQIDSARMTVVGVLPPRFEGVDLEGVDVWVPLAARPMGSERFSWTDRGARLLHVLARVNERSHAQPLEQAMSAAYASSNPDDRWFGGLTTVPLLEARGPYVRGTYNERNLTLAGRLGFVALVVLLVAVANVSSLLLMRTIRRRHEMAVRVALGASRRRLVALVVNESVALAVAAGVIALIVGWWGGAVLRSAMTFNARWSAGPQLNRAVVLSLVIVAIAGLAAGLAPAVVAARRRALEALKHAALAQDPAGRRFRSALLVTQTALCLALIACAGVFFQSVRRAQATDTGFDPDLLVTVDLTGRGPLPAERTQEALSRVRALPFVVSAAGGTAAVWPFMQGGGVIAADNTLLRESLEVAIGSVDSNYFATVGLRVLDGRGLGALDVAGSEPVAVVSRALARTLWQDRSPLGSCIELQRSAARCVRVVGVVADVRWNLMDPVRPQLYLPIGQSMYPPFALTVRTAGVTTPAHVAAIERVMVEVFSTYPRVAPVRSVAARLAPLNKPWRAAAILFALFGVLGLVSAAVGVYGLVNYDVTQRTRDLGIRIVMGARGRDVLVEVMSSVLRSIAIGLGVGLVGAFAATRFVAAFLFETEPHDPAAATAAVVLILAAAIVASLIAARRATQLDPAAALRAD